jgi:hypothetical protein
MGSRMFEFVLCVFVDFILNKKNELACAIVYKTSPSSLFLSIYYFAFLDAGESGIMKNQPSCILMQRSRKSVLRAPYTKV